MNLFLSASAQMLNNNVLTTFALISIFGGGGAGGRVRSLVEVAQQKNKPRHILTSIPVRSKVRQ
jgi:hypothetical protein